MRTGHTPAFRLLPLGDGPRLVGTALIVAAPWGAFFWTTSRARGAMTCAVQFQTLTLGYDRHPAVHRLHGEIAEGSLTAIVGPNGAGKSTILKGVIGTLRPLEGRIIFGEITRSEIAYLPQQSDIDRSFPIAVVDLVGMGLWREVGGFAGFRAIHRARVAEAISAVGLEGFEKRPIGVAVGRTDTACTLRAASTAGRTARPA